MKKTAYTTTRKFACILITAVLLLTLVPVPALAEDTEPLQPACTCETLCEGGVVNADCAVCTADSAMCVGKEIPAGGTQAMQPQAEVIDAPVEDEMTANVEAAQIAALGGVGILAAADYPYTLPNNTVTNIQNAIQAILDDNRVLGDTVTVTGSKTNADVTLTLTIPDGVTVVWEATWMGAVSGAPVIDLTGAGTFELVGGSIVNTGGPAMNSTGSVSITGGLALGRGTVMADVVPNAPTGNGMVVAWATPGQKQYIPGTSEDLAVFPAASAAKAMWEASPGKIGIRYDNGGGNVGLVPIDVIVSSTYPVIAGFAEVRDNTVPVSGTIDAPYKHFVNGGYVEVNGKRLNAGTDYTHKEGGTVITLTPAYLQTLKNDSYTVDVYFANNGKASTSLNVLVLGLFTIKATAGEHGSITPSGDVQVTETHNQTFIFTPDAGYVVDTVTEDGAAVTPVDNEYTFEAVSKDSTIHVTFKPATGGSPAEVRVKSFEPNMYMKVLAHGKKVTLKATNILPAAASDQTVTFKSSNTKVATVNTKGVVTAQKKTGKAVITLTVDGKTQKVTVYVRNAAQAKSQAISSVKANSKRSLTLYLKPNKAKKRSKTATATVQVNPTGATYRKKLIWTSSNPDVAKVNSKGKITARAAGKATITCITREGGKKVTFRVTVKRK